MSDAGDVFDADAGAGKQNCGRVGMETGTDGAVARRLRVGNVGEMGEDCGLRKRTNVEIGVFAMRSASSVSFFSTRLLSVLFDVRCTRPRRGDVERGDDDNALGG